LGLTSGLIIGPCLTPALGAILAYLATKKHIIYGTTLLFCFAYGMGFLLILVGTFSGLLANLPKSGKWMVYIKRLAAFILLAMGAYFIYVGIRRL
jgi:thiol:disulfide interchange protein DsbD